MLSLFQISRLENRIMLSTKHNMKYENCEFSMLLIFLSTKHDDISQVIGVYCLGVKKRLSQN